MVMNLSMVYLIKGEGQGQRAGLINKLKLYFVSGAHHGLTALAPGVAWRGPFTAPIWTRLL